MPPPTHTHTHTHTQTVGVFSSFGLKKGSLRTRSLVRALAKLLTVAYSQNNFPRIRTSELARRLEKGYRLCPFWSGIGDGFRGNYGKV